MQKLTNFFIDCNLNKSAAIRLLRIIKELLPQPNRLPTTWKSIMKILGYTSSSIKDFSMSCCFQRCDKGAQGKEYAEMIDVANQAKSSKTPNLSKSFTWISDLKFNHIESKQEYT